MAVTFFQNHSSALSIPNIPTQYPTSIAESPTVADLPLQTMHFL